MASFKDAKGDNRKIQFDAFVLDEIRTETGIDLCEASGDGWAAIQNDIDLVKVLAVAFGEPFRDFAKLVRGNVLVKAREAVAKACSDFIPPNRWSEIVKQSELSSKQKELQGRAKTVIPMLAAFDSLPAEMKKEIFKKETAGNTDSPEAKELASVFGLDFTPSNAASASLDDAELTPAE